MLGNLTSFMAPHARVRSMNGEELQADQRGSSMSQREYVHDCILAKGKAPLALTTAAAVAFALGLPVAPSSAEARQPPAAATDLRLRYVSRLEQCTASSASSAEIAAYDAASNSVLVTNAADNAIDVFKLDAEAKPAGCAQFSLGNYGSSVQSVAVKNGLAVAVVAADPITDPGSAVFFDPGNGQPIGQPILVGALPDMVTFDQNGSSVLVANEGEPRCYTSADPALATNPEGSVSIIQIVGGAPGNANIVDFSRFNGMEAELRAGGVRVGDWPGATVSEDLEPEYIAVSPDNKVAYVSLQENNAVAVIDLNTEAVTNILGLGLKNHRQGSNRLDASDRDLAANIRKWPVHGMYMPDSIAAFASAGGTYVVSANEGDGREYFYTYEEDGEEVEELCFTDETRVKDVTLAPGFRQPGNITGGLQDDENLGRLIVSKFFPSVFTMEGYSKLASFGGRSMSIWDAAGNLVWDSGDLVAQEVLKRIGEDNWVYGPIIGTTYTDGEEGIDARSDAKGSEPEAITTGVVNGRTLAFLGLERAGGIMMFDITNPRSPVFLQWQQTQDVSPEGLAFVPAEVSPTGEALLIAANEISGTTVIFRIEDLQD
jgi:YVTN family beta-propeller protein